ncbi:MAG: hypothetical protein BWX80_01428 [Candidatus Hydrogenedentes bacterium ADurb.Bin101]|jgi:hypothetical protein|nr:MAG: hypothetical protein BWX80_01428 [Candidatus Hydrogenedentes bacterium ADurb.Bin101]
MSCGLRELKSSQEPVPKEESGNPFKGPKGLKGLKGHTNQDSVFLPVLSFMSFKSFGLKTDSEFNRRFQVDRLKILSVSP